MRPRNRPRPGPRPRDELRRGRRGAAERGRSAVGTGVYALALPQQLGNLEATDPREPLGRGGRARLGVRQGALSPRDPREERRSPAAWITFPPALRGKTAFISDLKMTIFLNGLHSFFLSALSQGQKEAESDTENPFQTSSQEETRQLPDVDVLFFDINLCTHMGVFIDSCSHLLNFLLFI